MELGPEGRRGSHSERGLGSQAQVMTGEKAERLCSQEEAGYLAQSEGRREKRPVLGLLAWQGRVLWSSGPGSPWRIHRRVSIRGVSQAPRNIQKVTGPMLMVLTARRSLSTCWCPSW